LPRSSEAFACQQVRKSPYRRRLKNTDAANNLAPEACNRIAKEANDLGKRALRNKVERI
jgi:hypothetical protein